jgi:hypothetical protein
MSEGYPATELASKVIRALYQTKQGKKRVIKTTRHLLRTSMRAPGKIDGSHEQVVPAKEHK